MKTFPTLYQKTNTGAIQEWTISVSETVEYEDEPPIATIEVRFGQVGGKLQTTYDSILEGKNPGKKNATTPLQQAEKEALAKWTKQKKKGYVESIEAAQAGEVDVLVEGGIEPMLAQPFSKHGARILYPAYTQPKFDGIRCIAVVRDGKCTLWSRTRRPITGVPHIARMLEAHFEGASGAYIFDGELYNHDYKDNFEEIVSFVRQVEPKEGHEVVQYHIYDFPTLAKRSFWERDQALVDIFQSCQNPDTLRLVQTEKVESETELLEWFEKFTKDGFEGSMVRNESALYEEGKRSYGLQKIKDFIDEEFEILGFEEGRGKLMGHVAAFICRLPHGGEVKAKPMGELSLLKSYFEDHSLWQGKRLTIKYQGKTADGSLRFPVGVRVRESVDF